MDRLERVGGNGPLLDPVVPATPSFPGVRGTRAHSVVPIRGSWCLGTHLPLGGSRRRGRGSAWVFLCFVFLSVVLGQSVLGSGNRLAWEQIVVTPV